MNVRKNVDYSEMYAALDAAMATRKEQMELRERYLRAARQFDWSKTKKEQGALLTQRHFRFKCCMLSPMDKPLQRNSKEETQ